MLVKPATADLVGPAFENAEDVERVLGPHQDPIAHIEISLPEAVHARSAVGTRLGPTGGISAAWRPDGKELYYLNPAGAMMAAPITIVGATLEPGTPVVLFPTRIVGGGEDLQTGRQYDVAPDGRFLINTVLESAPVPVTLVMNWNGAVKK